MHRLGCAALLCGVLACSSGSTPTPVAPAFDGGPLGDPVPDAGTPVVTPPDAGQPTPDAGSIDPGVPDAGPTADAGTVTDPDADAGSGSADAGTPDADTPDAGTPDAGTPDAGDLDGGPADAGTPDAGPNAHVFGGLGAGPWPTAPMTVYNSAQGLMEAPISASTDELQNIWVVTHSALYVLKPGEQRFHRYTAADGLHVGPGYTEPPDFTIVIGGGAGQGGGECFVGYWYHDTHDPPGTKPQFAHTDRDPVAHYGKMDQVLLHENNTLEVRRYDFHNSNDGHFYETRNITQGIYDHVVHPGELYLGSNHGVLRVLPNKWRLPANSEERGFPISVERTWYVDHVHPWTHDRQGIVVFGDWFGMALQDDGMLWMGGNTSAGRLPWVPDLYSWSQNYGSYDPFDPAYGDYWPNDTPPIFRPPGAGDPVNIRAIALTDGMVWFASGEVENWRGPTYGLAGLVRPNPKGKGRMVINYYDPLKLGAVEFNILELVALPDGRLVLGFPNSGLLVWAPGDPRGHRLTNADGLPGEKIGRMYLDRMVDPPALYVPTDGGLAVFRSIK